MSQCTQHCHQQSMGLRGPKSGHVYIHAWLYSRHARSLPSVGHIPDLLSVCNGVALHVHCGPSPKIGGHLAVLAAKCQKAQ